MTDDVHALMSRAERRKPGFIKNPNVDGLVAAVIRLTMEVSALRDRLDIHEALAERHGIGGADAIEKFEPDPALTERRMRRRERLIALVVRDLKAVE
jgi:hypothetical protein